MYLFLASRMKFDMNDTNIEYEYIKWEKNIALLWD